MMMVRTRLEEIFTSEEMSRITINNPKDECLWITADVHGMKCCQARRFINNIINVIHMVFHLEIIHGYVHGTAIKEMLDRNFNNVHIIEHHSDPCNYGVTYITLAA